MSTKESDANNLSKSLIDLKKLITKSESTYDSTKYKYINFGDLKLKYN